MNEQSNGTTECRAPDVAPLLSAVLATRTDRHVVMDRAEIGAVVEKLREDREHPVAPIRFSDELGTPRSRSESPGVANERVQGVMAEVAAAGGHHVAMAGIEEKLRCDKPLKPLDRSEVKEVPKVLLQETISPCASRSEGPGFVGGAKEPVTCMPTQDSIDVLKTPVFSVNPGKSQFRAEFIQSVNGARAVRYWDRDLAYLDVVRFEKNSKPVPEAWKLGDALERSYWAHLATATASFGGEVPAFNYIHHLEVREYVRKKGIGSGLMRFVVHEIRSLDRHGWIWLAANAPHYGCEEPLFRFYERLGFRRLAPRTSMMYFDHDYARPTKVDPGVAHDNVAYVPR